MATGSPLATLVSGYARIETADLVGMTVSEAQSRFGQAASIPANARATLNGRVASSDARIGQGDLLVFDQPTGTKG